MRDGYRGSRACSLVLVIKTTVTNGEEITRYVLWKMEKQTKQIYDFVVEEEMCHMII